ncbi:MAG: EAL domain-containing protein [Burkholderiales bacterium]
MNSPDMLLSRSLVEQLRLVGKSGARLPANQVDWEALLQQISLALFEAEKTSEQLSLALEASELALYDVDLVRDKIYLSERWSAMLGGDGSPTHTNFAGMMELVHPDDRNEVEKVFRDVLTGRAPAYKVEHRVCNIAGEWRWILSHGKVVSRCEKGLVERIAGTNMDIHERKLTEMRVEYLAHHDELTGLPNRVSFNNALEHTIRQSKRKRSKLAVLFIDLDRFKNINDSLGHDAGDHMLQEVSLRLRSALRDSDIVARLGGDEFVVLIDGWLANEDLVSVALKILQAVAKPFTLEGQEYDLTTSIGISTYPQHGSDAQELLRHADVAMYRAKELGKNTFQFYAAQMDINSVDRLRMESALRRAITRDEFRLHYQPVLNLATGYMVGMEALVRWQHPQRGLVAPGEFIALAEETGLIVPLGEWVLRAACVQNRKWQQQGYGPLRVSVNLSPRQFQPNLVALVAKVLEETGLPAQLLELEITEGMVMQNADQAVRLLNELHDMGIALSIDDFGTGYSSLAYLKRFPIDSLKIDRSFITELPLDSDNAAIIRAIIQMAHGLEIHVVGEGVETAEQAGFLSTQSCDRVQGFHYSKPLPHDDFEKLIYSFPLQAKLLSHPVASVE